MMMGTLPSRLDARHHRAHQRGSGLAAGTVTSLLVPVTLMLCGGAAVPQRGTVPIAAACSAHRHLAAGAARAPSVGRCRTGTAAASAPTSAVQTAPSSQDARFRAPRPSSRRVHVVPPLARPVLLLADAGCWVLGDMRSTRCDRRAVLGSFSAVLAAACGRWFQVAAAGTYGAPALMVVTATGFHLGLYGQADAALSCSRAAAMLAVPWRRLG